jgi:hypothetical protein
MPNGLHAVMLAKGPIVRLDMYRFETSYHPLITSPGSYGVRTGCFAERRRRSSSCPMAAKPEFRMYISKRYSR